MFDSVTSFPLPAIGCTFNQLGNAGGFFLGPYMVQMPSNLSNSSVSPDLDDDEVEKLRRNISDYMWISKF